MSINRRMGPEDHHTRDKMLDAVEVVLEFEGYHKITARRIAKEAGFNHQTVYYYFENMDRLVVAAFKRRASISLERQAQAARSARPLRELLKVLAEVPNAKISSEFSALSSRTAGLREEVVDYLKRSSDLYQTVLTSVLEKKKTFDPVATRPAAAALLLRAIMSTFAQESALGFDAGHQQMWDLIEECLSRIEPADGVQCPAP